MTSSPLKCAVLAVAVSLLPMLAGCAPHPITAEASPAGSASATATATPSPTSAVIPSPTSSASASPSSSPSASASASSTPEPSQTATPTPTPTAKALLSEGDDSEQVRELQHRLLQLEWFEGKITSQYGEKTRLAVEGFQTKRGFNATGEVDQVTWDKLVDMTRKPTHDEMYNVLKPGKALLKKGDTGAKVKDLQARLKQIAWFSGDVTGNYGDVTVEAVKGFQQKREIPVTGEVDQRTQERLRAMTRTPSKDELNNVVAQTKPSGMQLDDRCLTGRVVCISKAQRQLAWVVDGKIRLQMDVRFGAEQTPTRNGVFSITWKSRDHVSSIYHTPMPYAMFFSGGQAIHYSSDFAARGYYGASHGCVNVRDKAAVASLFDLTRNGDKVVVYAG